jgi:hypothetical protein
VAFTLAANSTVGYDPSLQGILLGAGVQKLTIHGATITLDATGLSVPFVYVESVSVAVPNTGTVQFTGLPGTYQLFDPYGTGAAVAFTLAANSTVGYDPSLQGVLLGAGGPKLTIHGATITLDATGLSVSFVYAAGNSVVVPNTGTVQFTDLPGTYNLFDPRSADTILHFTLLANNTVSYDPALEGNLTGNSTPTLTIHGVTLTVDATALSSQTSTFALAGVGIFSTTQPQTFQVLAGTLSFQAGTLQFTFTISTQDQLSFDPSLDNQLSGRGTNTLTVT